MAKSAIIEGNLKLSAKVNPGYLAQTVLRSQVYDIFEDELLETADYLQQESYVGATRELKEGWDIQLPRRETVTFAIEGKIVNRADNAIFRLAGRAEGRFPPMQPIFEWVSAKIESDPKQARRIAFLVARKIAMAGTQRYRERSNIAGINRDGTLQENSPIRMAEERIAKRISQLSRS
jgi:hypothetical protein